MASPAHAYYCFEVLASSFDESTHPTLDKILELYRTSSSKHEDEQQDSEVEQRVDQFTTEDAPKDESQAPPQSRSISRLQAMDSPSRSETSTPSSVSIRSSNSQTTSSATTGVTTPSSYASRLNVTESYPMFVTWNSISRSGHKSLRGCIGTFEALPLEKGLEQYALTSAFEDTRFSPIPASLIPNLSCSLTLLADFEECRNAMDWTLGTHGIRINFMHRYRRHGATYLPDVAVEQGWTKEETLESLMRKAGWEPGPKRLLRGSSKPWEEVKDFHVIRYTGLKASASYTEWQEWRESVNLASEDT
ncbi:hypothetical protein Dsin_032940 [Dipteronia sinensis]|uniref:AMMECR1 domain-containing protein n=1 Tax=Dipteronia sinensis TaxID=43782 RepID=A0AAE0DPA4_9ROSI|nr:hypothetical protein Dsin_032940 [Dipteronia sinensis]